MGNSIEKNTDVFASKVKGNAENSNENEKDDPPINEKTAEVLVKCIVCLDDVFDAEKARAALKNASNDSLNAVPYSLIFNRLLEAKNLEAICESSLAHCFLLGQKKEKKSKELLAKISENIKLSKSQIKYMVDLGEALTKKYREQFANMQKKQAEKLDSNMANISNRLEEHQRTTMSQIIGSISVFTALAFILFGGISGISSLTDLITVGKSNVYVMLICLFFFAMVMLGCICLFIYFILQIIHPTRNGFPLSKITTIILASIIACLFVLLILNYFHSKKFLIHFF